MHQINTVGHLEGGPNHCYESNILWSSRFLVGWKWTCHEVFQGTRLVSIAECEGAIRDMCSFVVARQVYKQGCSIVWLFSLCECRYKQYLAKQVKQELNLDSTPTIDSDETHKEAEEPVVPKSPSIPVVSASQSSPKSRGTLSVDVVSSKPSTPSVSSLCVSDRSRPSLWPRKRQVCRVVVCLIWKRSHCCARDSEVRSSVPRPL